MAFRSIYIPIDRAKYAEAFIDQHKSLHVRKIVFYEAKEIFDKEKKYLNIILGGEHAAMRELIDMTATYYSPSPKMKRALVAHIKNNQNNEKKEINRIEGSLNTNRNGGGEET